MGLDPDPTRERRAGPTPNGGASSEILYLDAAGQPCPKSRAVAADVFERAEDGSEVFRTHMTLAALDRAARHLGLDLPAPPPEGPRP